MQIMHKAHDPIMDEQAVEKMLKCVSLLTVADGDHCVCTQGYRDAAQKG